MACSYTMPPLQFYLAAFAEYIAKPIVSPTTALIKVTRGVKSGDIHNYLAILIFIIVTTPVYISIAVQLRNKKYITILDVDNFIFARRLRFNSFIYCFFNKYSFCFYNCSFYWLIFFIF